MEYDTTLGVDEIAATLPDEDFLKLLPEAQQITVRAYATKKKIPCSRAFEELMAAETAENITDRKRQRSA